MNIPRTPTLLALAGLLAAGVGCDKQPSADKPEAEARESALQESSAQPGGDETSEEEGSTDESGPPKTLDDLPKGTNVLQHEMRLLNTAMRNTLTLIANDQLEGIPAQIKKVHPARQLTVKAIEKGAYTPPKNGDDMQGFKRADDAFHQDLKGLLEAAKQDDLEAATDHYGKLVDGCTSCHTKFRFK